MVSDNKIIYAGEEAYLIKQENQVSFDGRLVSYLTLPTQFWISFFEYNKTRSCLSEEKMPMLKGFGRFINIEHRSFITWKKKSEKL